MFFKISHNKIAITVCTGSATVQCTYLKGVCHKIFYLHFFHDSNTSRPLIKRLNISEFGFDFAGIFRIFKKLTVAVCIIPRSQTPHCISYRRVRLWGGLHIPESDSAVCITLRSHENKESKKATQCASHRGVRLCGVIPSAESSSTVCITPWSQVSVLSEILLLLFLCHALRYYYENYTVNSKLFKESFLFQTFFNKT